MSMATREFGLGGRFFFHYPHSSSVFCHPPEPIPDYQAAGTVVIVGITDPSRASAFISGKPPVFKKLPCKVEIVNDETIRVVQPLEELSTEYVSETIGSRSWNAIHMLYLTVEVDGKPLPKFDKRPVFNAEYYSFPDSAVLTPISETHSVPEVFAAWEQAIERGTVMLPEEQYPVMKVRPFVYSLFGSLPCPRHMLARFYKDAILAEASSGFNGFWQAIHKARLLLPTEESPGNLLILCRYDPKAPEKRQSLWDEITGWMVCRVNLANVQTPTERRARRRDAPVVTADNHVGTCGTTPTTGALHILKVHGLVACPTCGPSVVTRIKHGMIGASLVASQIGRTNPFANSGSTGQCTCVRDAVTTTDPVYGVDQDFFYDDPPSCMELWLV